jgi:mono/diheme cytochrome c family protein
VKRLPLSVLLALLPVTALLVVGFVLRRDPAEPHLEVLPADMARSPAVKSGEVAAVLPDGLTQWREPVGTIARGHLPLGYGPTPEEAARAGRELVNPWPDGDALGRRGEAVFARACAVCHGPTGRADAAVTKRGVPPPPTLIRPESRALLDGEIFHAITFGRKNMPSLALQTSLEDRWAVIRHVRRLQEAR